MNIKDLAYEMQNLILEAEKVDSLCEAMFRAIYRGDHDPMTYEFAFAAFKDTTYALQGKIKTLADESFELMKGEN